MINLYQDLLLPYLDGLNCDHVEDLIDFVPDGPQLFDYPEVQTVGLHQRLALLEDGQPQHSERFKSERFSKHNIHTWSTGWRMRGRWCLRG